jgi:molybdate transport system regulatory protein
MAKSINKILRKNKSGYKVTGTLWVEYESERFFGPGRVELLKRIQETGSINKAAKGMKMSYKKAWEMVAALNKQSALPLVILKTGGEHGGGSQVTDEAMDLIRYHEALRKRFIAFLQKETDRLA